MKRMFAFLMTAFSAAAVGFSQSNNYGNGNGTLIKAYTEGNKKWIYRKHLQDVQIGSFASGENLIVYDKPVLEKGSVVGTLHLNDTITITQVAEAVEGNNYYYWVHIRADKITGWLFCGRSDDEFAGYDIPYFDDRWEIIERITIRKKIWTVRKLISQRAALWERVEIRDKPGEVDTKIIATIAPPAAGPSQVNVTVIAASEESETIDGTTGRWLKIEHEGKTGWLFGGRASIERGGPQYYLPAAIIDFRLGGEY